MPQLQNTTPLAAAPFKKFLRVVMTASVDRTKRRFPMAGRFNFAGLFLISSPPTLPSRKREGNHSCKDCGGRPKM
jgi:hypothetical protein